MKFIFADSIDIVDPTYDFATESTGRSRPGDGLYPHELMDPPPYDGVLISRGVVGDHRYPGKYSLAQELRFKRDGARKFLRLEGPRFQHMPLFGDSGAFAYFKEDKPPYTPAQILEFYADAKFTHGCSVDHAILEYERDAPSGTPASGSEMARLRLEITLENAREFLALSREVGKEFTPMGVAQGWSPSSLADAAAQLEKMGYSYIAIGGLVPLRVDDIHACLHAVRERVSPRTRIHLPGVRAERIGQFIRHGIESFDSASPITQAFKDARDNYYALSDELKSPAGTLGAAENDLRGYTAIRIPQALENPRLICALKEGKLDQSQLVTLERRALDAVRGYDRKVVALDDAVAAVAEYGSLVAEDPAEGSPSRELLRRAIVDSTRQALGDRPWADCPCEICRKLSVEVVIFRSSHRNKRRGFHNLGVFYRHLKRLLGIEDSSGNAHV